VPIIARMGNRNIGSTKGLDLDDRAAERRRYARIAAGHLKLSRLAERGAALGALRNGSVLALDDRSIADRADLPRHPSEHPAPDGEETTTPAGYVQAPASVRCEAPCSGSEPWLASPAPTVEDEACGDCARARDRNEQEDGGGSHGVTRMKHYEGGGASRAVGARLAASRRTTSASGSPRSAAKSVSSGTYPC
jgi:hypothetical protein